MLIITNVLCEIFQGIIIYYFFSKELTARYSAKKQITLFTLLFAIAESTHFFLGAIFRIIFVLIYYLVLSALLYTDSLKSKIIVFVYSLGFQTAAEIISYVILICIITDRQSTNFYLLGSVISKLLQGVFLSLLLHTLNLKRSFTVSIKYSYASLMIPALSIVMTTMFYYSKSSISLYDIFSILILFIIDILSIVFFNHTQEIIFLDNNNKLLQQEKSAYLYQCNTTRKQWEELRSFRHDIKNSYITELALLDECRYDELRKCYNSKLEALAENKLYSSSGNIQIDALINYKASVLEAIGGEFTCNTQLPKFSDEDNNNIVIIAGNLLDNCIEALSDRSLSHRFCSLDMLYNAGNLTIDISNNFSGERKIRKGNKYPTTKPDSKNHGIGLKNIEHMLKSYDGALFIKTENNVFHVTVHMHILPL